jgi:hypothetical protein
MTTPDRIRFVLTEKERNLLEDNLLLESEVMEQGIEQPDGRYQFDLSYEELELLAESLAAAINHADDVPDLEARLDKVYEKLEKLLD